MTFLTTILTLVAAVSLFAMGCAIHELRADLEKTKRRLRDHRVEQRESVVHDLQQRVKRLENR